MLNPAINDLISYVPDVVLHHRLKSENINQPDIQEFEAVTVFIDISGFTSLAEKLAQDGNKGIEKLRDILNYYFGKLINLVLSRGGDIVKFAGDALMVVWPGSSLSETPRIILTATGCALEIQKIFAAEAESKIKLSAKIGVDFGIVRISHLGGMDGQWETLVSGEAVIGCTNAQQHAERGQVIITELVRQIAGQDCSIKKLTDYYFLLQDINFNGAEVLPEREPLPQTANGQKLANIIYQYLPLSVKSKVNAGQSEWLAELRKVTVLFINIPALNQSELSERNQQIIFLIQEILKKYEGTINKISVDDKGASLLIVFGLPPLAHEDDPVRGLLTALDISRELSGQNITASIGISSGRVFCGEIGSRQRREYTIIGDTVNFGARLMQAAGGMIFSDFSTYEQSTGRISFTELAPLAFKGKSGEFRIFKPLNELKKAAISARGIIGRTREISLLKESFGRLIERSEGSFFMIRGDAGIGKSKLLNEFINLVKKTDYLFYAVSGNSIEKNKPYHIWKAVFNQVFDISGAEDLQASKRNITDFFDKNNLSLDLLPLLNPVLPFDLPESTISGQMSGEVKVENTNTLMLSIIRSVAGDKPLVLVFEDAHYIDSASWKLILILKRELLNLLAVIASRPVERQVIRSEIKDLPELMPVEYFTFSEDPEIEKINLGPLNYDEVYLLVCQKLGCEKLSDKVAAFISARAEGHPFFSEELAYALRDTEMIEIKDGFAAFVSENTVLTDLPNNIEGVITSRIDRLSPPQQLTLKVASVIGRSFKYKTLEKIYPVKADLPYIIPDLVKLEKLDIAMVESPFPELTYMFKQSLIRDVVYNLMLNNQQQQLHKAVAQWYEEYYSEDLTGHYSLLAYHWQNAGVKEKTVEYLVKSGEKSISLGIYREALVSLDKALHLLDDGESREKFRQDYYLRIQSLLGEAYYGLGRIEESAVFLENYVKLLGYPVPTGQDEQKKAFARALIKQVFHRFGFYRVEKVPQQAALMFETARVYEILGQIYYLLSKKVIASYNAVFILNIIEEAGTSPQLGRAYSNFALILGYLKMTGLGNLYVKKALEHSTKVKHPPSAGWIFQITGLYSIGTGKLEVADNLLSRAIESYESFKDIRHKNESLGLLSFIKYLKGDLQQSISLSSASLAMAVERGDLGLQARAAIALLRNHLAAGDEEKIQEGGDKVLKIFSENIEELVKVQAYGLSALACLRSGKFSEAFEQAEKVLMMLLNFGATISVLELELYSALAEVFLTLKQKNIAISRLDELLIKLFPEFEKFSKLFVVTLPRFLIWKGLAEHLNENKKAAVKNWLKALSLADKLALPFETGLANYFLFKNADRKYYQDAADAFAKIGAGYHLALLEKENLPRLK